MHYGMFLTLCFFNFLIFNFVLKMFVRTVAAKKWPECSILPKIIDIESEHEKVDGENKEFILIGTLYKDMSLRGSVRC